MMPWRTSWKADPAAPGCRRPSRRSRARRRVTERIPSAEPLELVLLIEIPGEPVSKGRPRFFGGHAVTPKETRGAEQVVGLMARQRLAGRAADDRALFAATLFFATSSPALRDLDNLAKLVLDALNKIVWKDDRQVEELHAKLVRGDARPRTVIEIHRTGELPPPKRKR